MISPSAPGLVAGDILIGARPTGHRFDAEIERAKLLEPWQDERDRRAATPDSGGSAPPASPAVITAWSGREFDKHNAHRQHRCGFCTERWRSMCCARARDLGLIGAPSCIH